MTQQWRIGIRGKQRKDLDLNLLVQAVIALGYQLRDEAAQQQADCPAPDTEEATSMEKGEQTS